MRGPPVFPSSSFRAPSDGETSPRSLRRGMSEGASRFLASSSPRPILPIKNLSSQGKAGPFADGCPHASIVGVHLPTLTCLLPTRSSTSYRPSCIVSRRRPRGVVPFEATVTTNSMGKRTSLSSAIGGTPTTSSLHHRAVISSTSLVNPLRFNSYSNRPLIQSSREAGSLDGGSSSLPL